MNASWKIIEHFADRKFKIDSTRRVFRVLDQFLDGREGFKNYWFFLLSSTVIYLIVNTYYHSCPWLLLWFHQFKNSVTLFWRFYKIILLCKMYEQTNKQFLKTYKLWRPIGSFVTPLKMPLYSTMFIIVLTILSVGLFILTDNWIIFICIRELISFHFLRVLGFRFKFLCINRFQIRVKSGFCF